MYILGFFSTAFLASVFCRIICILKRTYLFSHFPTRIEILSNPNPTKPLEIKFMGVGYRVGRGFGFGRVCGGRGVGNPLLCNRGGRERGVYKGGGGVGEAVSIYFVR